MTKYILVFTIFRYVVNNIISVNVKYYIYNVFEKNKSINKNVKIIVFCINY